MEIKKILSVKNLNKSFGEFKAVNNINLQVNQGDIYGFLGPNGAGKSTTLRMILGLIKPDNGEILINGKSNSGSNRNFLTSIGALIEKPDFYKNLSAYDNLKILYKMSKLKDINRISEVLKEVDLWDKKNQKVGGFSQGMKQRLGIAQTLMHQPSLIILDEPSNGLDPQGQSDMRSLILRINDRGPYIQGRMLDCSYGAAKKLGFIKQGKTKVQVDVIEWGDGVYMHHRDRPK